MNNYTQITFQQLLEKFKDRLNTDDRFKNLSASSIYHMFMEMMSCTTDMINYYIGRTADEAFLETAQLDSSHIKNGKNLGYNPRRCVPAKADLKIQLHGPLPQGLVAGAEIAFSKDVVTLYYNDRPYKLKRDYVYKVEQSDLDGIGDSTWTKDITLSVPIEDMTYYYIQGKKAYDTSSLEPISVYQYETKQEIINASNYIRRVGKNYQFYDVNDINFSNWYGKRDPNTFNGDVYNADSGLVKISIGPDYTTAIGNGLFDIEDYSIYLNSKVNQREYNSTDEPLRVCSITTNSDKTIRIQFGDGNIVLNGLNNSNDNIYVDYIVSDGADANTMGIIDSALSNNNQFYATQKGSILDVSNNITFTFNSEITGGQNFESNQEIKNNAPGYYASVGKVITRPDFVSFFKGLTYPLTTKGVNVWSQHDIEKATKKIYNYIQNYVMYCIVGKSYLKDGDTWGYRNIFEDDSNFEPYTLYGDDYFNHLNDYTKMLLSFDSFMNNQYIENPSSQSDRNIKYIRELIEPRMEICSKLFSFPPIVNYYDLVGTIELNPLTKISDYKEKVENDIYNWLNDNTTFKTKINKSDISRFFYNYNETKSTSLDFKISDVLKSPSIDYSFNMLDGIDTYNGSTYSKYGYIGDRVVGNYTLYALHYDTNDLTDTQIQENLTISSTPSNYSSVPISNSINGGIGRFSGANIPFNYKPFNVIKVSKYTDTGLEINSDLFKDRTLKIKIQGYESQRDSTVHGSQFGANTLNDYDNNNNLFAPLYLEFSVKPEDVYENSSVVDAYGNTEDFIFIKMPFVEFTPAITNKSGYANNSSANPSLANTFISIQLAEVEDYYTKSNLNVKSASSYGLNETTYNQVLGVIVDWFKGASQITEFVKATGINLPYEIVASPSLGIGGIDQTNHNYSTTREETMFRRGINDISNGINENVFWNKIVPEMIKIGWPTINQDSDVTSGAWANFDLFMSDLYPLMKYIFADYLLDSDNNIVNYTMDNEISIVRLNLTYKYRG